MTRIALQYNPWNLSKGLPLNVRNFVGINFRIDVFSCLNWEETLIWRLSKNCHFTIQNGVEMKVCKADIYVQSLSKNLYSTAKWLSGSSMEYHTWFLPDRKWKLQMFVIPQMEYTLRKWNVGKMIPSVLHYCTYASTFFENGTWRP